MSYTKSIFLYSWLIRDPWSKHNFTSSIRPKAIPRLYPRPLLANAGPMIQDPIALAQASRIHHIGKTRIPRSLLELP